MAGAAAEDVKVLGLPTSPFVIRILIALRLKRVEYELVEVRIVEPKSEISPTRCTIRSPCCSTAENLSASPPSSSSTSTRCGPTAADPPPSPRRPLRPRPRSVLGCQLPALIKALRPETEAAKATELAGKFRQVLGLLEEAFAECSKGKGFFGGDAIGFVDFAMGSCLGWIVALEKAKSVKLLDAEELPRLAGWAERFLAEESVKALVPDADEYLKFYAIAAAVRTSATPAA